LQGCNGSKQRNNGVLQPAFDALQAYNGLNQRNNEALQPAFDALQLTIVQNNVTMERCNLFSMRCSLQRFKST